MPSRPTAGVAPCARNASTDSQCTLRAYRPGRMCFLFIAWRRPGRAASGSRRASDPQRLADPVKTRLREGARVAEVEAVRSAPRCTEPGSKSVAKAAEVMPS